MAKNKSKRKKRGKALPSENLAADETLADGFFFSGDEETDENDDEQSLSEETELEKILRLLGKDEKFFDNYTDFNINDFLDVNVFSIYGLEPFEVPAEDSKDKYNEWRDGIIKLVDNEWGKNFGERSVNFQNVLRQLTGFFLQPQRCVMEFITPLKNKLYGELGVLVKDRAKDGVVDVTEFAEIVREAEDKKLCVMPDLRKETVSKLDGFVKNNNARRTYLDEDFINIVKEKNLKLLDTENARSELLKYYSELDAAQKYIDGESGSSSNDEKLEKIFACLKENSLSLVSPTELFEKEVFDVFINDKGIDIKAPIDNENFYWLHNKSRDYEMSENDWKEFVRKKKIEKEADAFAKFNFGLDDNEQELSAKNIEEVLNLFPKNKERAKGKIYDGDLGVFLNDSKRSDLKDAISAIRRDYASDRDAGYQKTLFTLAEASGVDLKHDFQTRDLLHIAELIEDAPRKYYNELTKENNDLQLWLEVIDKKELADTLKDFRADDWSSNDEFISAVVLELEGGNVFRFNSVNYYLPSDIVSIKDIELKDRLAKELKKNDSKFKLWQENNFDKLSDNVDKWLSLGRINGKTLDYALEEESPYHYDDNVLADENVLVDFIYEKAKGDDFADEFISNATLRDDMNFWLENYGNSSLQKATLSYLQKAASDTAQKKSVSTIASFEKKNILDAKHTDLYFSKLLPVFENAFKNDVIEKSVYDEHKKDLLKFLNKNSSKPNDYLVKEYLSARLDDKDVDNEFIYDLLKYFFRKNIDKNYYVANIQPLVEKYIQKGVLPASMENEQSSFFLEKSFHDLPNKQLKEQVELMAFVKNIEPDNKYVLMYENAINTSNLIIGKNNFYKKMRNGLRRDGLVFMMAIITLVACFFSKLHQFLTPEISHTLMKMPHYFNLIFLSYKGNWIIAGVVFAILSRFAIKKFFRTEQMTLDSYDLEEQTNVMNHVIGQIQNGTDFQYTKLEHKAAPTLVGRAIVWLFIIATAYVAFSFSGNNPFVFVLLGLGAALSLFFVVNLISGKAK